MGSSSKRRKIEDQNEALSMPMAYHVLTFTTAKSFHSFSLDITRGAEALPVPVLGGVGVPLFDYATQVFVPGTPRVKISLIFQTFQQPSNVPLSLRFDDRKGWCLVTRAGIPTGTPVCCYVGELVPQKQIRSRQELGRRGQGTHLLTVREHTSRGLLVTSLDAGRSGNISRFVNHSCAPNLTPCPLRCGVFVPTVVLVTLRDVAAGEELTFSYGRGQRNSTTHCYCGAADCQAFLPLDYFWDT